LEADRDPGDDFVVALLERRRADVDDVIATALAGYTGV
jgi:hypothetical protein